MQAQTSRLDDGIHVASGYGLKVYVERGHLVVHDGVGRRRQTRRYNRATSRLKRLVVIGHTGFVTLDALRWLADIGAAFVQLDGDARIVTVSAGRGSDLPGLRRAQALAAADSAGTEISRAILRAKLSGQRAILDELPDAEGAREAVNAATEDLERGDTTDRLLAAEASAALAYWEAWRACEVRFGRPDRDRVPDHWRIFGQRHSPLTGSPRLAASPANAILNYLYGLLEAEASVACAAVGLDPGLGLFHRDRNGRDSLALDLMEACRPAVDGYVLALLREHTFRRSNFSETRRGVCRVLPPLARSLAETAPTWREHVAPVAEATAQALAEGESLPTRLTEGRRRAAWDRRRGRTTAKRLSIAALPKACGCGADLPDRRRRYCDACRCEQFRRVSEAGRPAAAAALAQLRGEGRDPAHGGEAARKRGRKNAEHQRAVAEWDKHNRHADPSVFAAEILPGLQEAGIGDLVAATGLSEHYCSLIRLGKRVPHRRHWAAFARIASSSAPAIRQTPKGAPTAMGEP